MKDHKTAQNKPIIGYWPIFVNVVKKRVVYELRVFRTILDVFVVVNYDFA